MVTSSSAAPGRRGATRFRWVILGFVVLLAIGLAVAYVVHERYVAYTPVAARHVPADASLAARFDLTHVALYEPFRRFVFPLADLGNAQRRDRLAARGAQVAGAVQEVVLALGRTGNDWLIVLGGRLPSALGETLATVLIEEGARVERRSDGFVVEPAGVAFAQAADGAFLIAASPERLRTALLPHAAAPELLRESGGIVARSPLLPAPLERVEASLEPDSGVQIRFVATGGPGTELAVRALLAGVAGLHPELAEAMRTATLEAGNGRVRGEVLLPTAAAERLTEAFAARAANWLASGPGRATLTP
ncbi:MAG TPA: hypothetical protein VKY73_11305 [Polyangiaceae bacterium]|nr:hypothetical protein [Polyangiaceae bacterium]